MPATPSSTSVPCTNATRSGSASSGAERLTATCTASGHSAAAASEWRRTHRPRGTIRRVSSATGMKSSGLMVPRSGWCQRTSASQLLMASVCRSTTGWNTMCSSSHSIPRRRSRSSSNRSMTLRLLRRIEARGPISAVLLRPVHRGLGIAQCGHRAFAVPGDDDPDAERRVESVRADRQSVGQPGAYPPGELERLLAEPHSADDDHERVAVESGCSSPAAPACSRSTSAIATRTRSPRS